jgi:hypothetical protein
MAVRFLCLCSQFQCVKGFSGILSRVNLRFVLDVFFVVPLGPLAAFLKFSQSSLSN